MQRRVSYTLFYFGVRQYNSELLQALYIQLESCQSQKYNLVNLNFVSCEINNRRLRLIHSYYDRLIESLNKAITYQTKNVYKSFRSQAEGEIARNYVVGTESLLDDLNPKILRLLRQLKVVVSL